MVQHYVATEATRPSRMDSISDVFPPTGGRTQVSVVWELIADAIDGNRTRYTNRVTCYPTDVFMDFLQQHGQTFEQAAAARQAAGGTTTAARRRTSPSIARRALAKTAGK